MVEQFSSNPSTPAPFISEVTAGSIVIKGDIPLDNSIDHSDKDPLYHLWKPIQDDIFQKYRLHVVMTACRICGEIHIRLNVNQLSLLEEIYYIKTEREFLQVINRPRRTNDTVIREQSRILQQASCDYVDAIVNYITEHFPQTAENYPVNLSAGESCFTVVNTPAVVAG